MLSVLRVHLPSDIPIAGCELTPYVLLRKPDGTVTTDDLPESAPADGYYLRCRWYVVVRKPSLYLVEQTLDVGGWVWAAP